MAACLAPSLSVSGGLIKASDLSSKSISFGQIPKLAIRRKCSKTNHKLSVLAEYNDGGRSGSGGGDFVAGFFLGGAVFGTLAFVFAPQMRRFLLNENEHGFRRAKRPVYYDEGQDGLEATRETLNAKIKQLGSAIDNVSSRLKGGKKKPPLPVEEPDRWAQGV
ncbi:uncharacterized protein LOC101222662 [Cucumis sativus]|uniref:Uncharacterized protein n=1 Tax=Cucumis sativus TaxID=3659 RepID=A0A0A0LNE4_CUCSA|nr:uncharacterized protein LOC101222662 [Cucumis sativus]KGN63425.1 hypothetical protein Csa_022063 [Cucumis sativus]